MFSVNSGIGLAPPEPGIATTVLALHPPIDFIFSDSYMIGIRSLLKTQFRRQAMTRQRESGDLREMADMYSRWKKAA